MSSRGLHERLQKLQQLKKRKNEGEKKNREELFKEHKKQSIGEGKLRAMELKQVKAMEELDKIESQEKGEDWDRKKGWDYSIEDNEKWEKKQEMKNQNKNNGGFINYAQLAEQSYKKEMSNLEINKEEYLKQKEKLKQKKARSDDNSDNENGNEEVDYSNKPSKAAVDRLVTALKGSDSRKLRRRKDYKDTDTFINDKNKQFNEKLNRHYDKHLK